MLSTPARALQMPAFPLSPRRSSSPATSPYRSSRASPRRASSSTKPPLTSEQRQAALQLAMETHYRALFHRSPEFALYEMRTEKARSVRNIIAASQCTAIDSKATKAITRELDWLDLKIRTIYDGYRQFMNELDARNVRLFALREDDEDDVDLSTSFPELSDFLAGQLRSWHAWMRRSVWMREGREAIHECARMRQRWEEQCASRDARERQIDVLTRLESGVLSRDQFRVAAGLCSPHSRFSLSANRDQLVPDYGLTRVASTRHNRSCSCNTSMTDDGDLWENMDGFGGGAMPVVVGDEFSSPDDDDDNDDDDAAFWEKIDNPPLESMEATSSSEG